MRALTAILPVVAMVAVTSAAAQEATVTEPLSGSSSKWEWTIAPYVWAAGVSLDMQANGNPGFGADASFSDLIDKLDIAGMLHFEARHEKWGLFSDALYMSVSDDSTSAGNPPIPDGSGIAASLKMGIYELGGLWRPGGQTTGFDLLFGVRLIDAAPAMDVAVSGPLGQTVSIDASKNYLDGLVGVRYVVPFAKRWSLRLRGDVSAGGTDLTWNAVAGFGVEFGESGKYSLTGGYRYLNVELGKTTDSGTDVTSSVAMSGPILGFGFRL